MRKTDQGPIWINLIFYWTLTTALGGALIYPLVITLSSAALGIVSSNTGFVFTLLSAPLAGAVGGGLAGFGQWGALRRWFPASWGWPLVTILGYGVGLGVTLGTFFWLLPEGFSYITLIFPFLLGGAIGGWIQVWVLGRWFVEPGWWILASAVGWAIGWVVSLGLVSRGGLLWDYSPGVQLALMGGIHGALIGFESGIALIYLIVMKPKKPKEVTSDVP